MTTVEIAGRSVRLRAGQIIGQGGEATIYRITPDTVLKLYKLPTDQDFVMNPMLQQAAVIRLGEQQRKLPAFPSGLPSEVLVPNQLVRARGDIIGFTMPYVTGMEVLMQYGARAWCEANGVDTNQTVSVFRQLHTTVQSLHRAGLVIGDFNDLNVLTDGTALRLVDADSMQFGGFLCRTFTGRFLDPLLTDGKQLVPVSPHNQASDWYAYFVMLIQSLLYVGPYGGVHRPVAGARLQHDDRVLGRLTVLHPEVVYPKPARPFAILPDELQAYFHGVTEQDQRGVFPLKLLDNLRFTTCVSCGNLHARPVCPQCQAPGAVRQTVTIRGQVTARRVFRTTGRIVQAAVQRGQLHYLYEERGTLYREGGNRLMDAALSPELRFRLRSTDTLIAHGNVLLVVASDGTVSRRIVDCYQGRLPMCDSNGDEFFWLQDGQLRQSAPLGTLYLGDVLPSQTLFWVGERLGFGLYRAGQLVRGFVFRPGRRGLNDQVAIGTIRGQLVDAACALSDEYAWFFTITQEDGTLMHRVRVINVDGSVVAEQSAITGEDNWLGAGIRGHMAVGHSLFAVTDDGLVRVACVQAGMAVEREFPDTEPFVHANVRLMPAPGGIYVVSTHDITLLTIH
ncbi:hypothetical protein EYC58_03015 [Candidatus Saccharibacteria bacterium]|nr:MAG: hypothetical protein EYC58_03015 [Candidatus Saccharibacteria bacterium]